MSATIIDCTTGDAITRPLTSAELAQQQTDAQAGAVQDQAAAQIAQADSDDRTARQTWLANIQNDITTLTADSAALTGTGTLTTAQLRAMLARADDAIVRLDRGLVVLARILSRRGL